MTDATLARGSRGRTALLRALVIGMTSFLTLVDLFAAQALLPSLTVAYGVDAATMGFAVNATTIGMAVAGLVVALISRRIDRKRGIWVSLMCLAVPTALLGVTEDVTVFAVLRIAQGLFMSAAFTLTMAYLAEECSAEEAAGAMAAYITGNVASNLFGRLLAAEFADAVGLSNSFFLFAALNFAGGILVLACISPSLRHATSPHQPSALAVWLIHLRNTALQASFAIGFLILFAFIGVFTYVNFVLVEAPLSLDPVSLGLVYFVFLPSLLTTPLAGALVRRFGLRPAFVGSMAVALLGLALIVLGNLVAVLVGLALVAIGTFCAQAATTGFVGRAATADRAAASGLYLASYYLGGVVGAILLGQVFDAYGWGVTVAAVGVSLVVSCLFALRLVVPPPRAAGGPSQVG